MMPKALSISLVTCSFEQGKFIDATMRSVLAQDYAALEYLIIDGGSRDDSVKIIKRHAPHLAYWVSEPDSGQTDALIKGFKRSQGEIMGWLCSDDLLLPGALTTVSDFFSAYPDVRAAYGDSLWIDGNGDFIRCKREMPFNRFVFLYDHNYVPQPSMFWRRCLYDAVGGLDANFNLAMDSDLWERFSAKTRISHIAKYLSCMRFYPEQKTRSMKPKGRREDAIIRCRRPPHSHLAFAYPLLHMIARLARVSAKAMIGAYSTTVPQEYVQWLEKRANGSAGQ